MASGTRLTQSAAIWILFGALASATARSAQPLELSVDWSAIMAVSKTVTTLQVVVNPLLQPTSPIHDQAFAALKGLGADYVRFVPWYPYPRLSVAELEPPRPGKTSWDFSLVDPPVLDFLRATQGHRPMLNFSTAPAWLFKNTQPVTFPADAEEVSWTYTQGTELVDPSGRQLGEYFARLVSWYTQGGFTDENGEYHKSGHHYEIPWWEVLNEPDLEHSTTPEEYTRRYDAIVAAIRRVSPGMKFVGLALATPNADMFEYFLDPRHHRRGTPLDMISYHFYAIPGSTEGLDQWQYSFFSQADTFVSTVKFIEMLRQRLSPSAKTAIDEVGSILLNDAMNPNPAPIPAAYWNLSGATYAYLFLRFSALGIDVLGESQLVGYPTQFPDVSMIDWTNGKPNARFWVLQLLKQQFTPGDALFRTTLANPSQTLESMLYPDVAAQAYRSKDGERKVLLVNKRNRTAVIALPPAAVGGSISTVDEANAGGPPQTSPVDVQTIELAPFAVAVITLP
jgi:hypothetical protein